MFIRCVFMIYLYYVAEQFVLLQVVLQQVFKALKFQRFSPASEAVRRTFDSCRERQGKTR